jgi:hypothetical protein
MAIQRNLPTRCWVYHAFTATTSTYDKANINTLPQDRRIPNSRHGIWEHDHGVACPVPPPCAPGVPKEIVEHVLGGRPPRKPDQGGRVVIGTPYVGGDTGRTPWSRPRLGCRADPQTLETATPPRTIRKLLRQPPPPEKEVPCEATRNVVCADVRREPSND